MRGTPQLSQYLTNGRPWRGSPTPTPPLGGRRLAGNGWPIRFLSSRGFAGAFPRERVRAPPWCVSVCVCVRASVCARPPWPPHRRCTRHLP